MLQNMEERVTLSTQYSTLAASIYLSFSLYVLPKCLAMQPTVYQPTTYDQQDTVIETVRQVRY